MTTNLIQKVCIYGAGAIGAWIGCRLAAAGAQVSVVARGQTLAALRADGLRLTTSGHSSAHPVTASDDPTALGVQDLVVVAVKAPSLLSVAQQIGPLLGPNTVVLTAMNGVPWWFFHRFGGAFSGTVLRAVDATGQINALIPPDRVVGCVVHASCATTSPGHVRHHFGNTLILGEPSGARTDRVLALAGLLAQAGFEAPVSGQIRQDVWYKLWGNMTTNPISALTGATTDLILADELVVEFATKAMLEAREIGAQLGLPIEQLPADRHAITQKLGAFKTSMLQDVQAHRAVELDALVTVVKELGLLTGVPTPTINALLGLSRLHARVLGLYPAA